MRKKKLKVDRDTWVMMRKIWGKDVPYDPTINKKEVKDNDNEGGCKANSKERI